MSDDLPPLQGEYDDMGPMDAAEPCLVLARPEGDDELEHVAVLVDAE